MDFVYVSNLEKRLNSLIIEGYHLFSSYKFGTEMGVCTDCCLMEVHLEKLQKIPVEILEVATIYNYLDSAESNEEWLIPQIKYLLPRIFELLVKGEELRHSPEITLNKLHIKDCPQLWQDKEIDYLNRFALAFFEYKAVTSPAYEIDTVLVMFHLAGLEILPLLNKWLDLMDNPDIILGFIESINYANNLGTYISAPFDDGEFSKITHDWLAQPETKEIIYAKLLKTHDDLQNKMDLIQLAFEQL